MGLFRIQPGYGVARNAATSFAIQAVGLALAFAAQVAVARIIGVADYGVFAGVLAWLNASVVIGRMGYDTAVLRFGGHDAAAGDWSRLAALVGFATRRVLLFGSVAGALMFGAIALGAHESRQVLIAAGLAALALPVAAASSIRQSALLTAGQVARSLLPDVVIRPIVFVCVTVFAAIVGERSAGGAMAAHFAAITCAFAVGSVWLARAIPTSGHAMVSAADRRTWAVTARSLLYFNAAYAVLAQADMMALTLLGPGPAAGAYYAARQLTTLTLFGMIAIQLVAAPQFAALHKEAQVEKLQRIVSLTSIGGLAFALLAGTLLIAAGRPLLAMFGSGFEAGLPALYLLVVAQLVNAWAGPVGILASMAGQQRIAAGYYALAAVVTAAIPGLLYESLGLLAPALGVLIGTLVWTIGLHRRVVGQLGIETRVRWRDLAVAVAWLQGLRVSGTQRS